MKSNHFVAQVECHPSVARVMCHPFVAGCRNGNGNPVAATRNIGVRILPVAPAADSRRQQAAKSTNYASHPRPISLSCRDFGKSSLSLSSLNYYSATNFNRSEHASANSTYIEISTKMSQTVVNHSFLQLQCFSSVMHARVCENCCLNVKIAAAELCN